MAIGTDWYSAKWCLEAGLYSELADSAEDLDVRLENFVTRISNSSSQAITELKKVLWEDTKDWETLLPARAEITGKLVLSDFTKKILAAIK